MLGFKRVVTLITMRCRAGLNDRTDTSTIFSCTRSDACTRLDPCHTGDQWPRADQSDSVLPRTVLEHPVRRIILSTKITNVPPVQCTQQTIPLLGCCFSWPSRNQAPGTTYANDRLHQSHSIDRCRILPKCGLYLVRV